MKSFFKWLPVLAACAALTASCSKDDPQPGPGGEDEKEYLTEANALTAEGANIKLDLTDYTTFEWTIVPNSECLSYRCEIMMADRFENDLWEQQKERPDLTATDYAKERMFATDGSGAGTWNGERAFSSSETIFQQAVLFPDTEYYIMVWGCLTPDGENPSEYTQLLVRTADPGELVGSPRVQVEGVVNYRASQGVLIPNEDAAYFNMMTLPGAHVREFLEVFSEEKLCNVISSFAGSPISIENCTVDPDFGNVLTYRDQALNWGFDADSSNEIATVGVARDVNMKMYPVPAIAYYKLKEKDPNAVPPSYEYTFGDISAYAVRFRLEFDPATTANVYYSLQPNTAGVPVNAADLIQNGGWVVGPDTFDQFQYISPGVHNYMYVSARNFQADIIEPMDSIGFPDPKPIPVYGEAGFMDESEGLFDIKITNINKSQATVEFYPDEDKIACYWFAALYKNDEEYVDPDTGQNWGHLTDPANAANTAAYLIQRGNVFTCAAKEISKEDWGSYTFTSMESDAEFTCFALAETWEGKLTPVRYADFTTKDNEGGPNPTVSFDLASCIVDQASMTWTVRFVPNEDATRMRFMIITETDVYSVLPDGVESTNEEKATALWERLLGNEGGMENVGTPIILGPTTITDNMLAVAMAYGSQNAETGEAYRSKLYVLRLDLATLQMEEITDQFSADAQALLAKVAAKYEARRAATPVEARPLTGHTATGIEHPALLIRAK